MKIPLIIATNYSGSLEWIVFALPLFVTLPLSLIALLKSFSERTKPAARIFAVITIALLGAQFLVYAGALLSLPRNHLEPIAISSTLMPVVLTTLALVLSRHGTEKKPNPEGSSKKSALATLSLVFSCCSIITPLFAGSIAGIICGHLAMREIQRNPELEGKKRAKWGLIIGYFLIPVIIAMRFGAQLS